MKKAILVATAFLTALTFSCSSDDDGNNDIVLGKWKLEQTYTNDVSENISDCVKKSTMVFHDSGSLVIQPYDMVQQGSENICDSQGTQSGFWKNLGKENKYEFTIGHGDNAEKGTVTIVVEGNRLTKSSTFIEEGKESVFKEVFQKQ